jgi:hypothetical protein
MWFACFYRFSLIWPTFENFIVSHGQHANFLPESYLIDSIAIVCILLFIIRQSQTILEIRILNFLNTAILYTFEREIITLYIRHDITEMLLKVALNNHIHHQSIFWPASSHWQTLSHKVVSSTPRHERYSHSQLLWR